MKKKRNKFQISKEHEILLEATLQIFVQFGILLFELLDSKTKKRMFMRERMFEIMSLLTSVLTLSWGICSCKMNMQFKNPNVSFKLKLWIRSIIEIVPRIAALLSVIVLSLDWKYGVLVSTMIISLGLFISPCFGFLYNKLLHGTSSVSDRTNIFLPFTIFKSDSHEIIRSSKQSRIENKMVSSLLMMLIIFTEALVLWEIIPLSSTDVWSDCHNRKIEIQSLVQILWGTMSFCITLSSIEIIYFYCTNKTWIEFIYADEEKPSDDDALNDGQEEDIVHKSWCCFSDLTFIKKFSVDKTVGLILLALITALIIVFTLHVPHPGFQTPTNLTNIDVFLDELNTFDKNDDFCEYLRNKSEPDVVYTMHEMIRKKEKDELVIAMVSCKPTPSTVLKYQDWNNIERYQTALIRAIRSSASTEIIDSLIKYYPGEINARTETGMTPILWAAAYKNIKLVPHLIDHGAQYTDTDYQGQNMLHLSIEKGIIQQYASLINKGNCNGVTPLHYSCLWDKIDVVKTMLENGGDPDAMNTYGATAKDYCCRACENYECADKCKLIQGGSTLFNLCQQNPWNVLVVEDNFSPDEIKEKSKDCCSSCKNKKCTVSCEIIGRGYTSKEICSANYEFILKLEEYLDTRISGIILNYIYNCRSTCKSDQCKNNNKLLDGWFKQKGFGYMLH